MAGITSSANATAITISADEEVTLNSQPACLANCNGGLTDKTGDGTTYTVPWGQVRYNVGSDLSGTTFTAPITGKYLICSSVYIAYANSGPDSYGSNVVTSNRTYGWKNSSYLQTDFVSWSDLSMKNAVVADMDAGDTAYITVRISGMTKTVDLETGNGYDYFSVILLA